MSDKYEWITIGAGRQVLVKKGEEPAERRRLAPGAGWPLECVGSAVNPSQAGELRQFLSERGCPTEVNPRTGAPKYRNALHRRKALKLRNMHDNASFD